jgi:hypothetical protein
MGGFEAVEVVATGDLPVPAAVLALLWPAVGVVTAGSEDLAAALRASGARNVRVLEPFDGARLGVVAQGLPTVGVFEPGALLLRQRARRSVGVVARRVLGRRAPAVRSYLRRVARLLRRAGGARP